MRRPLRILAEVFRWAVVALLSVLAYGEYVFYELYKYIVDNSVIGIMMSSNPAETEAFLGTLLVPEVLVPPVLILLGIYFTSWLLARWRIAQPWLQTLLAVGVMASAGAGGYFLYGTCWRASRGMYTYEVTSSLDRMVLAYVHYADELEQVKASAEFMYAKPEIFTHQPKALPLNVVLVIGESTGAPFMHCYGYPLENTPRLDSLIRSGLMVRYNDVVSPAPNTRESLMRTLTLDKEGDSIAWYHRPSLLSLVQEAGYQTVWTSNQDEYGIVELSQIIQMVDDKVFLTTATGRYTAEYVQHDESVLPLLKKNQSGKNFQVIHLMGTHFTFKDRYPTNFAYYKASDVPTPRDAQRDQTVAEYANAIRYTDDLLGRIIDYYNDVPTLLIYLSDHGQVIYEDATTPSLFMHSLSHVGVSIPLLVYANEEARSLYPELKERLLLNVDKAISTDLLTYSICDLLGIETKYSNPQYSFFNPIYDATRPRLVEYQGKSMTIAPLSESPLKLSYGTFDPKRNVNAVTQ